MSRNAIFLELSNMLILGLLRNATFYNNETDVRFKISHVENESSKRRKVITKSRQGWIV